MSTLVRQHTVEAAEGAGEEYARWAGLNVSQYRSKLSASQQELQDFLSRDPRPLYDEPDDDFGTRTESGYCGYRPSAPYETEYDETRPGRASA